MRNFVVFSLPRSRSTWLSVFLSSPDAPCGHDIGPTLDSLDGFAERLRGDVVGTCETGAAFAWRLIREALPDAVFAVIRRDRGEVAQSLARFGLTGLDAELAARDAQLDEVARQPGTLTLDFADLNRPVECARLYAHCLGRAMPVGWWAQLAPLNIQVDMPRQLAMLAARHGRIEALKAQARERLAYA